MARLLIAIRGGIIMCLCIASSFLSYAEEGVKLLDAAGMEKRMAEIWEISVRDYYSTNTGLFYTRKVKDLPGVQWYKPEEFYKKGNYNIKPYKKGDEKTLGYNIHGGGTGTEDCSMLGGILLAAMCDWYEVTKDEGVIKNARMVLKGLLCAATVHGQSGFIARGVCHEDGKSIFPGSSRDQFTHSIHGMWRYYNSPMSDNAEKEKIRAVLCAVADKMTREVTPTNNDSFDFAYGIKDDRGVAKMLNGRPAAAARLAMFYAAAWDTGKRQKDFEAYRKYLPEALAKSAELSQMTDADIKSFMPAYVIIQMEASLEVLYMVEKDDKLKNDIGKIMDASAQFVSGHAFFALPSRSTRDRSEILEGLMMAPGYRLSPEQQDILRTTISKATGSYSGANYTLLGAYWRARSEGYFKP